MKGGSKKHRRKGSKKDGERKDSRGISTEEILKVEKGT